MPVAHPIPSPQSLIPGDQSRHDIIPPVLRPFRSILPKVHPTAYIDQSAQVIGDVEIGQESSVWMNVVIRGDVNTIRTCAWQCQPFPRLSHLVRADTRCEFERFT